MDETKGRQSRGGTAVRIVVQNLQKQAHLGSDLIAKYEPDFFLAQEINLFSEDGKFSPEASFTYRMGYGTAIYSGNPAENPLGSFHRVESPHAEIGGFIRKKTIIATTRVGEIVVQMVSFHGYNGQPFKRVSYLVDHVQAVLDQIEEDCAIFAGDFNTWTQDHLDAIKVPLERAGFQHALSWPYPGRDFPLDHVFLKGSIVLTSSSIFESKSDHRGALLTLHTTIQ